MDRCKWRKMIKEARWSGWVWVGECFFWYRPTRVVPDQRPLNGRCCCCCVGAVIYLQRGADCLHMVQLMPLPSPNPIISCLNKSRPYLPFWHRLTQIVLEKRPLNGCSRSQFISCYGTERSVGLLGNGEVSATVAVVGRRVARTLTAFPIRALRWSRLANNLSSNKHSSQ